jgi:HEAT repeat protein
VTLAGDAKPSTRYQAIAALDATHDARAAELLATMLTNEKDLAVRRRLLEALNQFGSNPATLPALQTAKEKPEPELKPFLDAILAPGK